MSLTSPTWSVGNAMYTCRRIPSDKHSGSNFKQNHAVRCLMPALKILGVTELVGLGHAAYNTKRKSCLSPGTGEVSVVQLESTVFENWQRRWLYFVLQPDLQLQLYGNLSQPNRTSTDLGAVTNVDGFIYPTTLEHSCAIQQLSRLSLKHVCWS